MTDNTEKQLTEVRDDLPVSNGSIYNSLQAFQDGQRIANALASSSLVPQDYRGNVANTLVALEMAQRTGSSPMAVMQNMHVIHGRPSWSSQFVIAALNSCGRFSPLRFKVTGKDDDETCIAWAYDKATGEELEGPPVSIGMAKAEGWYSKNGSKWKTMPQLMLRYRAAKFFGNLYAPDILMGMHASEEVEDFGSQKRRPVDPESLDPFDNQGMPSGGSKLGKKVKESAESKTDDAIDGEIIDEPAAKKKPEPEPTPEPEPEKQVDEPAPSAQNSETQDEDDDLF